MNVVILSDHDARGGAAIATCRIEAQVAWGPNLTVFSSDRRNVYRVVFFADQDRLTNICLWHEESEVTRQLLRLPRKLLPAWFPRPNTPEFVAARLRRVLRELHPDVINVHNLHAAAPWGWGPHLIEVCLEFAPVVWTLHDMWSFTGRCSYSYDCEKFITGCNASCPTPGENPILAPEKIQPAWDERRAIYARHRNDLVIVTPSRWLANQARRGLFAQHRIDVIPYGIAWGMPCSLVHTRILANSELFNNNSPLYRPWRDRISDDDYIESLVPLPREEARRELGIHPAGPVLLLAAVDLTERRKGAEILPKLWQHIQQRPFTVLTMGRGTVPIDDPLIEVHPLGWIDDDRRKALAYSAADALLHPAPVDNFPNVVLEAMACGTPTIAMPVGGVPEMVRPGVSGWLADAANPAALGQAVDRAVRDLSLGKNLRESCRTLAEKEYSLLEQGRRYFELFRELRRR